MSAPDTSKAPGSARPWWQRLLGVLLLVLLPLGWWAYQYPPQTPQQTNGRSAGDDAGPWQGKLLDRVIKRGYLRVATRISPTIYIPDPRNPQGIEYDLVERFAKELGVGVQFIVVNSLDEAYDRVYRGEADFAAAGLVVSARREQRFRYGPSYLTVRRQLIYRRGVAKPKSIHDIGNNYVSIARGSSTADWLNDKNSGKNSTDPDFPSYIIQTRPLGDGMDVIDALDKGEIDYAVVFSHEALLGKQISDNLRIATDLGPPVSFAWAFSRRSDGSLFQAAQRFFAQMRASHVLKTLIDRYYSQFEQMNKALAQQFLEGVEDRIQPYLAAFKAAGKRYDIDWRLLAAMGYQESKWRPNARSNQGAVGLMQITHETAKELGLRDRRNPVQNIMSAAKYINYLRKLVPDQAQEPDLTYFALAAYNIGIGHLGDAIELTRQQGGNPNLWRDVRLRILELSNPKYYRHLRYGYARGEETVQYVENIRAFHDLMIWIEERHRRMTARTEDEPRTSTTVLQ